MKNRVRLTALAIGAAMLVSGCGGNNAPAETAAPATAATSATQAAETTADTTTTAVTTSKVEALGGEDDTNPTNTSEADYSHNNGKASDTDIMGMTIGNLTDSEIQCENRDSLHFVNGSWTLKSGEAPQKDEYSGWVHFSFDPYDYRFMPGARFSSGAMSTECDDAFRAAVASAEISSYRIGWNDDDVFKMRTTEMSVGSQTGDGTVFIDKIEYGFDTRCYDRMFVVNAFVRTAAELDTPDDNSYGVNGPMHYEIIIDPAYMRYLELPMTEFDPERMKFTVNGTDFYADTIHGIVQPVSYLNGGSSVWSFTSDKYVYAKVVLMAPSFLYDNINGASVSGSIMCVEPITEDTDSIIQNGYEPEASGYGISLAIQDAMSEMIGENTISFKLIDLNFDGLPEVITQYCDDVSEVGGPYSPVYYRVYSYEDTGMVLAGEFKSLGGYPVSEAIYIPTGEHGWYFYDYKDHCFMTLKNGKLNINHITEQRPVGEKNEYGWYDNYEYYYLGEKIVLEPYEAYNPLTGKTDTYYRWSSGNSLGYSVMNNTEYSVYDMLFSSLTDDFKIIKNYDLEATVDAFGMNDSSGSAFTDGRLCYIFTPGTHFPADIVDVYQRSTEAASYEAFYGISYEGAKEKPVIYLYPEEETDVSVSVNFPLGGELTCTYPEYIDGWNVTAEPDGTLYDANGDEYYCLYWEGRCNDMMTGDTGFCVAGADTAKFLREKLMYIGLTAREANEFIIYWLPRMQDNPYNVITLHTEDYTASVPLTVSPAPDTQIRVFMTYRASDKPVDIPEQTLPHYGRSGFTLVEWGGNEG